MDNTQDTSTFLLSDFNIGKSSTETKAEPALTDWHAVQEQISQLIGFNPRLENAVGAAVKDRLNQGPWYIPLL